MQQQPPLVQQLPAAMQQQLPLVQQQQHQYHMPVQGMLYQPGQPQPPGREFQTPPIQQQMTSTPMHPAAVTMSPAAPPPQTASRYPTSPSRLTTCPETRWATHQPSPTQRFAAQPHPLPPPRQLTPIQPQQTHNLFPIATQQASTPPPTMPTTVHHLFYPQPIQPSFQQPVQQHIPQSFLQTFPQPLPQPPTPMCRPWGEVTHITSSPPSDKPFTPATQPQQMKSLTSTFTTKILPVSSQAFRQNDFSPAST